MLDSALGQFTEKLSFDMNLVDLVQAADEDLTSNAVVEVFGVSDHWHDTFEVAFNTFIK